MSDNDIRVQNIKEQFIKIYTNCIHRPGADQLLDFLVNKTEFFTMPASTRFHLSREAGLAEHSIDVYLRLSQLYSLYKSDKAVWDQMGYPNFAEKELGEMAEALDCEYEVVFTKKDTGERITVTGSNKDYFNLGFLAAKRVFDGDADGLYVPTDDEKETIAIVGLLHDLCKYDLYRPVKKSRKTGNKRPNGKDEWEDYMGYEYHDSMPFGHGEMSVYIIQGFMRLKREEAMAIRWHMGYSDVSFKGGDSTVSKAFDMYPLAALAHMADLWASHIDETQPEKKIGGCNA